MRLFAKRSPPKLLNVRNEDVYDTAEFIENKNIKIKCNQLSANEFKNLDENTVSLEK